MTPGPATTSAAHPARTVSAGLPSRSAAERPAPSLSAAGEAVAQRRALARGNPLRPSAPQSANRTGLPHQLKAGVEQLSGLSMDDVRVTCHSPRPAQLQAHAFAQGNQIHVGPGQEKHLPHEAWHVVQQKLGRVPATRQFKGRALNDNPALEQEADRMGQAALQRMPVATPTISPPSATAGAPVLQAKLDDLLKPLVPGPQLAFVVTQGNKVIDQLLPALMGALPFDTAQAAISFAEEVLEKWLRFNPEVARKKGIRALMRAHLQEVIAGLPVTEKDKGGGEDEHDEEADDEDEKDETAAVGKGAQDPRFIDAKARLNVRRIKEDKAAKVEMEKGVEAYKTASDIRKTQALAQIPDHLSPEVDRLKNSLENLVPSPDPALRLLDLIARARTGALNGNELHEEYLRFYSHNPAFEKTLSRTNFVTAVTALNAHLGLNGAEFVAGRRVMDEVEQETFDSDKSTEEKRSKKAKGDEMMKAKTSHLEKRQQARDLEKKKALASLAGKGGEPGQKLLATLEKSDSGWSADFAVTLAAGGQGDGELLESYEEVFAARGLAPGAPVRAEEVDGIAAMGALGGIDPDQLKSGHKSDAQIVREAIAHGWITKDEVQLAEKLIGPRALAGILLLHMRRGKPGPLRGMIEQLDRHRAQLLTPQSPLTSTSMVIDSNLVELITADPKNFSATQVKRHAQLLERIEDHGITDLRLANINVAELHAAASLIGKKIPLTLPSGKQVSLPVLGLPFEGSRGRGTYRKVFEGMEKAGVGENKGSADRSMLADIYASTRATEKDGKPAEPHFVTADIGITKKVGDKANQFNPATHGVAPVAIREITVDVAPPVGGSAPVIKPGKKASLHGQARFAKIWNFPVGETHTALDLARLIRARRHVVYAVGGAVRDALRGEDIKDVDLKTDMPFDEAQVLLAGRGIPLATTPEINLIKAGQGDKTVDLNCAPAGKKKRFNLKQDARERDFTLNALYVAPDSARVIDPLNARQQAKKGELRLTEDPGEKTTVAERIKTVIAHMKAHPELLGRALKFIERGYRAWQKAPPDKSGKPDRGYHLEADILEGIHAHAEEILRPLVEGEGAPARKSLFLHKCGFKSPQELVAVMQRYNFPPRVIRMVLPDSVAGRLDPDGKLIAYNRDVFPRNRAVDPVAAWDPKAAPKLKVDVSTGRIYQYRIFAQVATNDPKKTQKILIDVDLSEHGIAGHPTPHHHVYIASPDDSKWVKKGHGFSNTGQPGLPPVTRRNGVAIYTGPTPWRWWNDSVKVGELDDKDVLAHVLAAAQAAAVPTKYNKSSQQLDLGGEISLPLARVRDLARDGRISTLLMLVHNLRTGVTGWRPEDDAVRVLTGSRGSRERLRFNRQLDLVVPFLKGPCQLKLTGPLAPKLLTPAAKTRLFDLVNANLSPEKCRPAAGYAFLRAKTPFQFVEYFEFFLAASANHVAFTDLNKTLTQTQQAVKKAGVVGLTTLKRTGDLVADVKAVAGSLGFEKSLTAAYHLHKHAEMTDAGAEKSKKPLDLEALAKAYLLGAREAVTGGEVERQIHDESGADILVFKKASERTVVRVNGTRAQILTSYREDEPSAFRSAMQFLSARGAEQGAPIEPPRVFNTPFGRLRRGDTLKDGDCLFRAAKDSAHLPEGVDVLRARAVAELRNNWRNQHYNNFLVNRSADAQGAITTAANSLARAGSWATQYGDLAPHLLGRALGRPIHILSERDGSLVYTVGGGGGTPITIFYNGGSHYSRSEPAV